MALHHYYVIAQEDVDKADNALTGIMKLEGAVLNSKVGDEYVPTHVGIGVSPGLDAHISQALYLSDVPYFRGTVDTSDSGYPGTYLSPGSFLGELDLTV